MNAADFPYLILLVGPGFIALQARSWASEDYRLSDTQRLIWSTLTSVVIFFVYHGLLRHFPWKIGSIASPQDLLDHPSSVPLQFLVALYAIAGVGGWLVGKLLDKDKAAKVLAAFGLDPARHRDVWRAAFRRSRLVTVFLSKGDVYRGWADENSTGLNVENRFVLLDPVWYRDKYKKKWVTPKARFVLFRIEEISHIEFFDQPAQESGRGKLAGRLRHLIRGGGKISPS